MNELVSFMKQNKLQIGKSIAGCDIHVSNEEAIRYSIHMLLNNFMKTNQALNLEVNGD